MTHYGWKYSYRSFSARENACMIRCASPSLSAASCLSISEPTFWSSSCSFFAPRLAWPTAVSQLRGDSNKGDGRGRLAAIIFSSDPRGSGDGDGGTEAGVTESRQKRLRASVIRTRHSTIQPATFPCKHSTLNISAGYISMQALGTQYIRRPRYHTST